VVCVQEVDWSRFQVPPEGRVARQLGNTRDLCVYRRMPYPLLTKFQQIWLGHQRVYLLMKGRLYLRYLSQMDLCNGHFKVLMTSRCVLT
jgi:hypothetical protein